MTKTFRTLMFATCLMTGAPALALAQSDAPPKHGAMVEDDAQESSTPLAVFGHFAIGGAHADGNSGLGLLAGVSARVGPVFVQANALDVTATPGNNFAFDNVDEGGATFCEDSEGEVIDDAICAAKTLDIVHRAMSIDASVFVPHTSMLVGVGDRFDHGTQTVFGSVGYVFTPDDTRAQYVLNLSGGDHYVAATIGIAFPLFSR
jgi:hypothetical protein